MEEVEYGDDRLPQEYWQRVEVDPVSGCWIWTGYVGTAGYGQTTTATGSKDRYAHRVAWRELVGEIPEGLEVDHLCHTADPSCPGGMCLHRRCVNPNGHLEPVTHEVNVLRGKTIVAANVAKTHCVRGHKFTPENTYNYAGERRCAACQKAYAAVRYQTLKQRVPVGL